jgi:hypothetical protein
MMLVLLEILRQVIQLNARRSFVTKTFSMKSTAFDIPLNVPSYRIWRAEETIRGISCHYSSHGKDTAIPTLIVNSISINSSKQFNSVPAPG